MDKIATCLERIRVIRGVNFGKITYSQIQNVFALYQLNEEQKRAVYESLKNSAICITQDDDASESFLETNTRKPNSEPCKVASDSSEKQNKQTDEKLQLCMQDIKDNPNLVDQYKDEMIILKNLITSQNFNQKISASRCITIALMKISSHRVRDIREHGWVCGTYMLRVRKHFEKWIQAIFTEDELCELVNCYLEGNDITPHQQDIIMVLLHNTPKTLVHPFSSSFLE